MHPRSSLKNLNSFIVTVGFYICSLLASPLAHATDNPQTLINKAIETGAREVVIPPGEYRLLSPNEKMPHLSLRGASNLVVDAKGVKLICERAVRALDLVNCRNVTVRGMTIDYDPLLISQGVIENVDAVGHSFTVKVHEGYPISNQFGFQVQVFDPKTRLLKKDSWQINHATAEVIGERIIKITTDNTPALQSMACGDFAAMDRPSDGLSHAISVKDCNRIVMEDVTIHQAPGFGIIENGGEGGNIYRHVSITPGPVPRGATEPRLRSICDDGIHCIAAHVGPTIENCMIERHGDDGIAIHGNYHLVLGQTGNTVKLALKREVDFSVGDTFRFYRKEGMFVGEAKITKIGKPQSQLDPSTLDLVARLTWSTTRAAFQNKIVELEITPPVALEAGDRVTSPDRSGANFIVRGNTIRNHRARGILVKASDGVIENNLCENNSIAGIVLAPEFTWMEADYSSNVLITGNTIRFTGCDPTHGGRSQGGAISVSAVGLSEKIAPAGGHRNILIANNTVENCRNAGLVLTSAANIVVSNNHFHNLETGHFGERFGIPSGAILWATEVSGVLFKGNQLDSPKGIVLGDGVKGAKFE